MLISGVFDRLEEAAIPCNDVSVTPYLSDQTEGIDASLARNQTPHFIWSAHLLKTWGSVQWQSVFHPPCGIVPLRLKHARRKSPPYQPVKSCRDMKGNWIPRLRWI
jgi:hypothetical protein